MEEKEVRAWVVASLEVVVVVEAVEVVVAEVVLDGRLVTPLKKILMKTLTKTMSVAIEGAMAGALPMTMTIFNDNQPLALSSCRMGLVFKHNTVRVLLISH